MSASAENVVEGETITLTVTASRPVEELVEGVFTPSNEGVARPNDFEISPLAIEVGETSATSVLTAVDDGEAEGEELLTLYWVPNGNGFVGPARITLWDSAVPALPFAGVLVLAALLLRRLARVASVL